MRPAYEGEPSATPIFDALYSEFRRRFRALPGDREGEEGLHFTGFGYYGSATGYGPWELAPAYAAPGHPQAQPPAPAYGSGHAGGYSGGQAAGYGLSGRHRGYLSLPPGQG
ncbi:hypothetical protein GXW83_24870 [Streptacidiphilus sp. PB12-B1b]|uniref:hypothetical protein n=1 Tax=Streptacidiphilus sp. PB12-B1b TaxID=2705012 RepID=UPI0015F8AF18|nr:hypothetical protein [Streptacidiphilus sp. PB12-B1b]QMU74411.1 hypothetical protein GXW83_24870 [Streptacidiphilus sp. PB12-B1b]